MNTGNKINVDISARINTANQSVYLHAFVSLFQTIPVVTCDTQTGRVTVYGIKEVRKIGRFLLFVDNTDIMCVEMLIDKAQLLMSHDYIGSSTSANVRNILYTSGIFLPFVYSPNGIVERDIGNNMHTSMFAAYANAVLVTGELAHETDTSRMQQLLTTWLRYDRGSCHQQLPLHDGQDLRNRIPTSSLEERLEKTLLFAWPSVCTRTGMC